MDYLHALVAVGLSRHTKTPEDSVVTHGLWVERRRKGGGRERSRCSVQLGGGTGVCGVVSKSFNGHQRETTYLRSHRGHLHPSRNPRRSVLSTHPESDPTPPPQPLLPSLTSLRDLCLGSPQRTSNLHRQCHSTFVRLPSSHGVEGVAERSHTPTHQTPKLI